jgi:GTP-binding protein
MTIETIFVRSAASASDLPRDGVAEIALVGRSNVGKSSLINALVGQRVARTSAAPGKTRLANVYLVTRHRAAPLYLLDLPGYGYARRSKDGVDAGFEALVGTVFARRPAGLLLVDARHPGLANDRAAWPWIRETADGAAVVATKIDKLAHGERIRALRELESVFDTSVLPVSAVTGEGLEELWTLIDQLLSNRPRRPPIHPPRKPLAPPPQSPRRKNSSSRH